MSIEFFNQEIRQRTKQTTRVPPGADATNGMGRFGPSALRRIAPEIYNAAVEGILIVVAPPTTSISPMALSVVLRPLIWRNRAVCSTLLLAA